MLSLLDQALEYAERGWHVFPVHTPTTNGGCSCGTACGSRAGKHPRTPNGLHDATTDIDQIIAWWVAWPDANIGIRTGRASGVWVLDLDTKDSVELPSGEIIPTYEHSLRTLGVDLPDTYLVSTGSGGWHAYFAYPDDGADHPNQRSLLPGIDGRGDGGYVVAPPSLHVSGHRYELAEERPLSRMPGWIEAAARTREEGEQNPLGLNPVAEGGRNDFLTRHAGRIRALSEDLGRDELFGILSVYNRLYCTPPLDDAEVMTIAKSAANMPGTKSVLDDTGWSIQPGADLAESVFELSLDPPPEPPFLIDRFLRQGERMIIAAQPNTGKSWFMLDLGMAVASGGAWMGEFPVTDPGPVLYLDLESARWAIWRRVSMLMDGRETSATQYKDLRVVTERRGLELSDSTGYATIGRLLDRYRPRLVVVDSLVRIHRGVESSSNEMASVFARVDVLRSGYNCAFAFAHHVRKPQAEGAGDAGDLMRGSSEIRAWPDVGITLKPGNDTETIEAHHFKQREGVRSDPFLVRLRFNDDDRTARVEYAGIMETEDENAGNRTKILNLVNFRGVVDAGQIAGYLGVSEKTARDHLRALVAGGKITQDPVNPMSPMLYRARKDTT